MKNYGTPAPPSDDELHDAARLELPDWSGMASHNTRMMLAEAVQWNEEMLVMFPPKANRDGRDDDTRCEAEFVL